MTEKRKTLADAGEYDFIRLIRTEMPADGGFFLRSAGDDCLVAEGFSGKNIISTIDTFVEGIHFTKGLMTFFETGARCMAASVSDIAAMSGEPAFSLVSLSMPDNLELENALGLFKGLNTTAINYGCPVAGGETTSTTGPVVISVTVIGTTDMGKAIYRNGAKPGESIYVSGFVGSAMGGLLALEKNENGFEFLKNRFIAPDARVKLSKKLTKNFKISSMIDLSDGIAADIANICRESRCGAELYLNSLPLHEELKTLTIKYGFDCNDFALSSGEDFELLFTSPDNRLAEVSSVEEIKISKIGKITGISGEINTIDKNNKIIPLKTKGYEHFKRAVKKSIFTRP